MVAEAEENNLGAKVFGERWERWDVCSLCKQQYHGVVACALTWACWKTYLGRPETDQARLLAMTALGNGLSSVEKYEDALSVQEAELSMVRRIGGSALSILDLQTNLADTYRLLGRIEEALLMQRDVYSERVRLHGEEHEKTVIAASNYAGGLVLLQRFEETKSLLRKSCPWRHTFSERVMKPRSG